MARTCIICGGATGSREHIFPAALGGRRTNKGIYCAQHNSEYSNLAGTISEQLGIFNAQLGVVGDHSDKTTPVKMTDMASGREVELTRSKVRFKEPEVQSKDTSGSEVATEMVFGSQEQADEWVRQQKAKGIDVRLTAQKKSKYYVGTAHTKVTLGGTDEGLRAIGYIAQTFLAHSFPEVARLPALDVFKDYTLRGIGSGFVWWDFDEPSILPPNAFEFGHRIVVGVDGGAGSAYARVSLFSSLNFGVLFGSVPVEATKTVITDIDPLAKSPPKDIRSWTEEAAVGMVPPPTHPTAALAAAISSGKAERTIVDLMRRITEFERRTAARELLQKIASRGALSEAERGKLFGQLIAAEAQRVFNLLRHVAADFKLQANNSLALRISALLDKAVELDPSSDNGLSTEATVSLQLGCEALKYQMEEDYKQGLLDQDRMEMLIGGGAGAAVVGRAIMDRISSQFRDR